MYWFWEEFVGIIKFWELGVKYIRGEERLVVF